MLGNVLEARAYNWGHSTPIAAHSRVDYTICETEIVLLLLSAGLRERHHPHRMRLIMLLLFEALLAQVDVLTILTIKGSVEDREPGG